MDFKERKHIAVSQHITQYHPSRCRYGIRMAYRWRNSNRSLCCATTMTMPFCFRKNFFDSISLFGNLLENCGAIFSTTQTHLRQATNNSNNNEKPGEQNANRFETIAVEDVSIPFANYVAVFETKFQTIWMENFPVFKSISIGSEVTVVGVLLSIHSNPNYSFGVYTAFYRSLRFWAQNKNWTTSSSFTTTNLRKTCRPASGNSPQPSLVRPEKTSRQRSHVHTYIRLPCRVIWIHKNSVGGGGKTNFD